jgi:glycosyltransferase involved in cell wall biosynthesis
VGETGEVCPSSNPRALATAMARMVERLKTDPGIADTCRQRVMERFSIERMAAGYVETWTRANVQLPVD